MEFQHFKKAVLQQYEARKHLVQSNKVAILKAEGERCRQEFLETACLEPPSQVRLINCHATCEENQVVLIDWCVDPQVEFAAISHAFGMEVYGVFDCVCTTKCSTKVPRWSVSPCPTHAADSDPRNRVVNDILNMCSILRSAGVEYAWHDGVCIAQHNKDEVEDTINHIGWIYSHARETIIFLHYVGNPMAPISPNGDFASRWQTRVWTLQEAALSKRRRYCVRVGTTGEATVGGCKSLQEFEDKIACWYKEDSSKVTVIEEEAYWKIIIEIYTLIISLCTAESSATDDPTLMVKAWTWCACISDWVLTLICTCFQFPTVAVALDFCSARDSEHEGDRINSILALAGLKDFVAPKEGNMEASTIEFFKRQGQQGLARAVFTANIGALKAANINENGKPQLHTWVPILSSPLKTVYESVKEYSSDDIEGQVKTSFVENFIEFTVLEDGKLELRGEMVCVAIKFTYMIGTPVEESPLQSGNLVVIHDSSARTNFDDVTGTAIAMDLTFDMDGFKSALAQASSLALGMAVLPIIINDEHRQKPTPRGHTSSSTCCTAACRWASEMLGKVGRATFSCCGLHADGASADDHSTTQLQAAQQYATEEALAIVSNGTLARACASMERGWMAVVPSHNEGAASTSQQLNQVPALNLGIAIFPVLSSGGLGPLVQGSEIQDKESFWVHMVLPLQALVQHHAFTSSHPPSQVPSWDWRVPALLVQGDLNAQVCKVGCFHLKKELKDIFTVLLPTLTKIHKLVII